jgi:hypothetical protein
MGTITGEASMRQLTRVATALALAAVGGAVQAQAGQAAQAAQTAPESRRVDFTIRSVHNDVSPPLRDMAIIPISTERRGRPVREHWIPIEPTPEIEVDPLLDRTSRLRATGPVQLAPTVGTSVDGLGIGSPGFSVNSAPPDTTGAVGATQFVQWVNTAFAIYSKSTKARTFGPANGLTLWSGFPGVCGTRNDGDPIVQYDKLANRWVLSQFAVPSGGPFTQCIAVSTTSDATGSYNRYQFTYSGFNDFPKVGVWPDGYYVTYNIFTNTFQGSTVCAIDRAKLLAGQPATQQCFNLAPSFGSTLPADLDGPPPPAGTPNFIVARAVNSINFWKFKVDWTTPGNTTLTGPVNVPVAAFSAACSGGDNCIPQPNTRNRLDSLADRLNFRAAYRQFAGYDSLVLNHAVSTGSRRLGVTAIRWHEFRNLATTPVLAQEGTFGGADGVHRWMGSIAQDKFGNVAIGYTASSSSVFPSVRFASRAAGDPAGTLGSETVLAAGAGSQTGGLTRWGDYSHTSIDPADDCTFWHTNEYLSATGSFNWNTRISSFKLTGCP